MGNASQLADPLDRIQICPVSVAGDDGMPIAGPVLEPSPPGEHLWAVLSVARPVLLNHPEAVGARTGECVGVVLHRFTVGRGSGTGGRFGRAGGAPSQ